MGRLKCKKCKWRTDFRDMKKQNKDHDSSVVLCMLFIKHI